MKLLLNLLLLHSTLAFTPLLSHPRCTTQRYAADDDDDGDASSSSSTPTTLDGRKIMGTVEPLNNFLLVQTAPAVEETDGGILLTGKAKIVKTEGTVVSVGPGRARDSASDSKDSVGLVEMPVQPGDGVVYGKFDGTEIDLEGVPHTLIRDDDILVKFSGDALSLDNVNVVRDNVLVYVEQKEIETQGGILLAKSKNSSGDRPSTGKVIKVGPGKTAANGATMPVSVSVDDMVKFRDFAGYEVEIEDVEYSVVKMSDILAKF